MTPDSKTASSGLRGARGWRVSLAAGAVVAGLLSSFVATAAFAAPAVETVGSPIRTATTARLEARLNPAGLAGTYHFEYGMTTAYGQSTPVQAAGSGSLIEFASQLVTELQPGTTYHYRVVGENSEPDSPSFGQDMTVTTRASDAPLSHGHFPGPAGSNRAWEQVNVAESGGNPVIGGMSFSDNGERALYLLPGGTSINDAGGAFNQYIADRTEGGWVSHQLQPPRSEVNGSEWGVAAGTRDLSTLFTFNANNLAQRLAFWRLQSNGAPSKLFDGSLTPFSSTIKFFAASENGSRDVIAYKEGIDPGHPVSPGITYLYDISTGNPKLVSLLPGNAVPSCGVKGSKAAFELPVNHARMTDHWLSADGSLLVFPTRGNNCLATNESQLYLRNIPAESTVEISGPPLSGPECAGGFIKQTPGAVFFWTQSRLAANDTAVVACGSGTVITGGDVYRYDISAGTLKCVTCFPSLTAEVFITKGTAKGSAETIAVAEDGSRVYFQSSSQLVPGAATPGAYRVDVNTGNLAYVAPVGGVAKVGDYAATPNAVTPDGSALVFLSSAPTVNALNGLQNGGTAQYYRYDDRDRSLTCLSCPQDGSAPANAAELRLVSGFSDEVGPNADPLDDGGQTFIFATPNALVGADQNTARAGQEPFVGDDVYEWRDGRQLLVSDGLASWPNREITPRPNGISSDGRDVFFTASAQYTPDAVDGYNRLYDARVDGGFEFPEAPQPCPLEVCQGTPKGTPAPPVFGSKSFAGAGNVVTHPKKRHRKHKKHKKQRRRSHHRAAHGNGRTAR